MGTTEYDIYRTPYHYGFLPTKPKEKVEKVDGVPRPLTERTQRATATVSKAAARTILTTLPRRRMPRREEKRVSAQKLYTNIRHAMLSSTRRATLDTSGGPTTTNVRVVEEAAKVSKMGGCVRQCWAAHTVSN